MHRTLGTALLLLVFAGPLSAAEPLSTLPAAPTTPATTNPASGGRSVRQLSPGAPEAILPRSGDAPVGVRDAFLARVGGTLAVPASRGVLINDFDPESDPIWATSYFPPANGALSVFTDGSFNYTTTLVAAGADSFQYVMTDGTSYSEFVTVRLDVLEGANRAPAAIPDHYATPGDETLVVPASRGLLVNDLDLDGDAPMATSYFPASYGEVSLVGDGSFTYVPQAGYQGTDQFQYIVVDAQGTYSAGATVTLEVLAPRNRAPLAQEDWYYTPSGTPLAVNAVEGLLRNDADPEGDAISAAQYFPPAEGSLSLVSDGSFVYTPPPAFTGVAQSSYLLVDAQGRYGEFAPLHLLVGVYGDIPSGVLTPPTADGFTLHAPSPNPFNPRTKISFRLGEDGPVQVRVYDVRGREVVELVDESLPAGEHDVIWEGRDAAGRRVADGPYVVELRDAQRRAVQKLMLVE